VKTNRSWSLSHEKIDLWSWSHTHKNLELRSWSHVHEKKSSGAGAVTFLRRLRSPKIIRTVEGTQTIQRKNSTDKLLQQQPPTIIIVN